MNKNTSTQNKKAATTQAIIIIIIIIIIIKFLVKLNTSEILNFTMI